MLSEEEYEVIPRLFIYSIIGCAVAILIGGISYAVYPYFLDEEREAFVHSHQYVEARRTEIQQNLTECRRINSQLAGEGLSDGLRQSLEDEKATLNDDIQRALSEIPEDSRGIPNLNACRP